MFALVRSVFGGTASAFGGKRAPPEVNDGGWVNRPGNRGRGVLYFLLATCRVDASRVPLTWRTLPAARVLGDFKRKIDDGRG